MQRPLDAFETYLERIQLLSLHRAAEAVGYRVRVAVKNQAFKQDTIHLENTGDVISTRPGLEIYTGDRMEDEAWLFLEVQAQILGRTLPPRSQKEESL